MPKFKHPKTGEVIEVSEEHANEVIRRQRFYIEVEETKRSRKKVNEDE